MKMKRTILLFSAAFLIWGCGHETVETPKVAETNEFETEADSPLNHEIDMDALEQTDMDALTTSSEKKVYENLPLKFLDEDSCTLTCYEVTGKLNVSLLVNLKAEEPALETAVIKQLLDTCSGFDTVTLTIQIPDAEYVYLYDLQSGFFCQESENFNQYGDFLATFDENLPIGDDLRANIDAYILDAKDYLGLS